MKKVYMIALGGSIKNANVEVHSVQFVLSDIVENAYPELINRWYGDSLHLDSVLELKYINGYKLDINQKPDKRLYMVVYGGYKKDMVDELHDYNFIFADTANEAKMIAKDQMNQYPNMGHVDEVVDVFDNLGCEVGYHKGDYSFKDNEIDHTFVKIK